MKKTNIKRLAAFTASILAVAALAVPMTALADDTTPTTYSITINNDEDGHTYEAYQIFAGDLSSTGILSNITWGSGVSEAAQTALGDAETAAAALTADNAAEFAQKFDTEGYLAAIAGSDDDGSDGYAITNLTAGYYLIKDKDGSLTGADDSYTLYILKVSSNTSVKPKSALPEFQKKVKDINDSTETALSDLQDSADHDIGDEVEFQLKGTVASNYDKYTVYKFAFHDTESEGLAFMSDSVVVKVDGVEVTSGYEVVTSGTDDCTFEIVFADLKKIDAVKAGSVITVDYKSKLDTDAVLGETGNPNEAYLEYSNNPNDETGAETGESAPDKVIVFTYETIINKVDGEGNPLTGAAFKLEKKIAPATEGAEAIWKEVTVVKNTEGTTFTFTGIDDGEYRLTETATPEGFNSIDPIYFTVSGTHDVESDDPELTALSAVHVDEDGANIATGAITFTAAAATGEISADVVNKAGSSLPETGGIGTTLFYIGGGALALGAGVLLVSKKRMANK